MAAREEPVDEVATEETGGAGDEDAHRPRPYPGSPARSKGPRARPAAPGARRSAASARRSYAGGRLRRRAHGGAHGGAHERSTPGPAPPVRRTRPRPAPPRATIRPMPAPELEATLDAALATLDDATIDGSSRATIRPAVKGEVPPEARLLGARFVGRGTLGEGGMGIVRLAEQRALGREVAIKVLKPEAVSPKAVRKLLQEAWITGAVQHPNVVPVYDIDLDESERPRIVLKRIEGDPWGELMRDAETVRRRFRAEDLLEWNLRVILDVLQALHFAHTRGFVHRDLKPENVMVGAFGEVYVLDWGIAVAIEDDGTGRFPLAKDATEMAGTPCYMAPEQLGGEDPRISPRTDVYLVGAMLHEMPTGQPPHEGDTLREILATVLQPPRPLGNEVDAELERIVRRAMDPDPDARFETAEQMRLALEGYLAHRDSRRLAALADGRRAELEEALEAEDDARVQALHAEVAFGYRAALETWPQNRAAREGLEAVTTRMIEHQLAEGDPAAAKRLLHLLEDAPEELAERVHAAQDAHAERQAALERLDREADRIRGRRTRAFFIAVLGTLWTVGPIWGYFSGIDRTLTPTLTALMTLGFLTLLGFLVGWARESMLSTRLNRTIVGLLAVTLGVQILWVFGARAAGLDHAQQRIGMLFLYAVAAAKGAVAIDLSLVPMALIYGGAFLWAAHDPPRTTLFMGLANGAFVLYALAVNSILADRALPWDAPRERAGDASGERE
ncbi:MAG: hypothetical protein CMH59_16375 [Myxococcales bacterium]|nr:hypothetical protein [Myxococcales bacterium]